MIDRELGKEISICMTEAPIVGITGPRQSGKTTLAQSICPSRPYYSFEDPLIRQRFCEDPRGFLFACKGGAVLDEAQNVPELFSFLQGWVDQDRTPGRFILTGSQNFSLTEKITQSLAGRIALLELHPFSSTELISANRLPETLDEVLFLGAFPPLYSSTWRPARWFSDYTSTYLQRDVRQWAQIQNLETFTRFLSLCAGCAGELFNASRIAMDCGVDGKTVRRWLSILEASYIATLVYPYHSNLRKRLVKTPKLFFYDTGLVAHLLGIQSPEQISLHPKRGALFENWVFVETTKFFRNRGLKTPIYFWRTQDGAEIDFVVEQNLEIWGIEAKSGMSLQTSMTRSLQNVVGFGKNTRRFLVYGGTESCDIHGAAAVPWRDWGAFLQKV